MPAARVDDMPVGVGPPNAIIKSSATMLIAGQPAARVGDASSHGGKIMVGAVNVIIGG